MIKYEFEGKITRAYFVYRDGEEVPWFIPIIKDLKNTFGIVIVSHELYPKIFNFVKNQPWDATVVCKGSDRFCLVRGREMAKKKLLKRYYICLFKCRDMVITYYEHKVNEAIKKAQLGKLANKIYDLEDELRND